MAKYQLLLPKMGESVAEATITKWLKKVGDHIAADDAVLEIATDKVDSEVPSPVSGTLIQQLYKEDDVAQVGAVIAIIETAEPAQHFSPAPAVLSAPPGYTPPPVQTHQIPGIEQLPKQVTPPVPPTPPPVVQEPAVVFTDRFYSPLVKSIASQEGIKSAELDRIPGTGADGRLTKDDLLNYISRRTANPYVAPAPQPPPVQSFVPPSIVTPQPPPPYTPPAEVFTPAPAAYEPEPEPVVEYIPAPKPVVHQSEPAEAEQPAPQPVRQPAPVEAEKPEPQPVYQPAPVAESPAPEPAKTEPVQKPAEPVQKPAEPVKEPTAQPHTGKIDYQDRPKTYTSSGKDEIIEMDRMRRIISDHMVMSKRVSPHVTSFVEVDVTLLVQWREKIRTNFENRERERITFTPIFIEAVVRAIKDMPMINVSVNGTQIIKKKDINIGMATALPSGNLIVPVIHKADELSLTGLTKAVNDLAVRARTNKLVPDEVRNGTFTITNVGSFGNVMGTPIINQPQVAILAIGVIKKKPAVIETKEGDMIAIRHMMFLSLSYDHRVVDGALGGSFVRRVADYLENWDMTREI